MDTESVSLTERSFLQYLDSRASRAAGIDELKKVIFYKPTQNLVNASIIAFVGSIFFVISFTSPYWLQSYAYTYNTFQNMGLWEFCFNGYRHFDFQYDKKYDGCNHVFAYEYQQILEWLLPPWLMATQAFMTISLITIIVTLIALSLLLVRWPLKSIMRYEWRIIGFCFWCQAITSFCVLMAVIVFGSMCWSRSWLLYPNFNYLSWSYIFAVICAAFEIAASCILIKEMYVAKERKREQTQIQQMQMEPQQRFGSIPLNFDVQSSQGGGYI